MKKIGKISGIAALMMVATNTVSAQTVEQGAAVLSVNWPYYIAVALIISSFVTFALIIAKLQTGNKGKKLTEEKKIARKYLIAIAFIQLLVIGIIPLCVLVNYFNYKDLRDISMVSTVWSDETNINSIEVKVFGRNKQPEGGIAISNEEKKLELLKMLSKFEMRPTGIPQLSQREGDINKWSGKTVEITNRITNRKIILELDSPYCCINNVNFEAKDSFYEKELSNYIMQVFKANELVEE
ncbi:MAG: hypothetical protein RR922_02430 [Clostridia bacterium]